MASWRDVREDCFAEDEAEGEARVKTDWASLRSGYFMYCGSPMMAVLDG